MSNAKPRHVLLMWTSLSTVRPVAPPHLNAMAATSIVVPETWRPSLRCWSVGPLYQPGLGSFTRVAVYLADHRTLPLPSQWGVSTRTEPHALRPVRAKRPEMVTDPRSV